jgi:hypothetical protein
VVVDLFFVNSFHIDALVVILLCFFCSLIGIIIFDAILVRSRFETLLQRGGKDVKDLKVQRAIDSLQMRFLPQMRECVNENMALMLYTWKGILNSNTKRKVNESHPEIIISHELTDAHSNKAFFQFVLINRLVNVFKYPKDPATDSQGSKSIQKDVIVTEVLCN